jgi:Tfp pilus assembly protein PilE
MLQKGKYLKGSTIIEVLIALAILSFCTSLAVIIYLNIQKSSLPFFKIKAQELATFYMDDALKNKTVVNETFKQEEFSVNKSVVINEQFRDCYTLRVIVFDNAKKKLFELESVVYNQN